MAEFLSQFEKVFLGKCHGVGLSRRGSQERDRHVLVQILTEDDDNWFTSENSFSSYWTPGLIEVLKEAQTWIESHCDKDPTGYGWVFRP